MTTNNAYPIESKHSVASRMCVIVFDNVPLDGHVVFKCLNCFPILLKGYM